MEGEFDETKCEQTYAAFKQGKLTAVA
jgi:hypothetical protein